MTDAQFRAQVRADAIKAGMPPDVADFLASRAGKVSQKEREMFADFYGIEARVKLNPQSSDEPSKTDERLRREVYGESVKVGYSAEVAHLIADACVTSAAEASEALVDLAELYGAKDLAAELIQQRVSVIEAREIFKEAARGERRLDISGTFRVRNALRERSHQ